MALRLGDTAPNFQAQTTEGHLDFYDWMGDGWAVLFSHPADFTPVCTTELGRTAQLREEFSRPGHFASPAAQSTSGRGGAILNITSSLTADNCVFTGNHARLTGGAISSPFSTLVLTNCSFIGNSANLYGGAIYNFWSEISTLTNCSFAGNAGVPGGAVYHENNEQDLILTNCILWSNDGEELVNAGPVPAIVNYFIVRGGYPGSGNLDRDPHFADAATGDLHLLSCSPAIDAGTAAGAPATNFEGDSRPFGVGYMVQEVAAEWTGVEAIEGK